MKRAVVVLQSSNIHLVDRFRCLSAAFLPQPPLMFAEKTQPKSMFCSAFGGLSSRAHLLLMGFSFLLFLYSLCILAQRFLEKKKKERKRESLPPGEALSERFHYRLSQHENVKRLLLKRPAWEREI